MYRLFFLLMLFYLFSYEITAQQQRVGLYSLGIDVFSPVGSYEKFNKRTYVGAKLGGVVSTRLKNLYIGGDISYGLADAFDVIYEGPSPIGFNTEYRERLANTHLGFSFQFRYLPDWNLRFQPYAGGGAGIRRFGTYLTTEDIIDDVRAGNQVYTRDWAFQVSGQVGVIIPLGAGFSLDVSAQYLETQAVRHLLRDPDWRDIQGFFTTDYFRELTLATTFLGFNISILYAF